MVTVREVADLCQLSERAVYRAIEAGELAGTKLRSRLRIRTSDVEHWITAGAVGQSGDAGGHTPAPARTRGLPRGEFRKMIDDAQELSLWTSQSE